MSAANIAFAQSPPGIGRKRPALLGQPLGDLASAVPLKLPQMRPVGQKSQSFPVNHIRLDSPFSHSAPCRGASATMRFAPGRAADIPFVLTSPSDHIRISRHSKWRAFTSLLNQGANRLRASSGFESNTARPQGPPRPLFGLCAAGQLLAGLHSSPSSQFARIRA
jgi:hypothetical protein